MESMAEIMQHCLTTEVLVAVIAVSLALVFTMLINRNGKRRTELLLARKGIRELLDKINCGALRTVNEVGFVIV